jgi:hypothetical protein
MHSGSGPGWHRLRRGSGSRRLSSWLSSNSFDIMWSTYLVEGPTKKPFRAFLTATLDNVWVWIMRLILSTR